MRTVFFLFEINYSKLKIKEKFVILRCEKPKVDYTVIENNKEYNIIIEILNSLLCILLQCNHTVILRFFFSLKIKRKIKN